MAGFFGAQGGQKPGVPSQREAQAVGFAAVAGRAAGHIPAPETPGRRVTARDRVGIAPQPEHLRPESVQTISTSSERPHDLLDFRSVLATAHTSHPDQRQCGEIDAVSFVEVRAPVVVRNGLSLQYRDDRQLGREITQSQVVGDRAVLMDAHRRTGACQDMSLRHVVHWRGPLEVADLGGVAAKRRDVAAFVDAPPAVHRQLREASGVARPRPGRARQAAPVGQPAVGDQQRDTEIAGEPGRLMRPEEEPHRDTARRAVFASSNTATVSTVATALPRI